MDISDLAPDTALAAMLDKKVLAKTTPVRAYGQLELPNTMSDSDYIHIMFNGNVTSVTDKLQMFNGGLALSIYSKLDPSGGVARKSRIRLLEKQVYELTHRKSDGNYFFEISETPITPISANSTTGYAYLTLNIQWHTK
jgi:hypothetical protein